MATDSAVTPSAQTGKDCPYMSIPGTKKRGRCQQAQISPSSTLARANPKRAARRGRA